MDVSNASGIRNFIPGVKKEAEEKKTDMQKQLIALSKQDNSLAKMSQQKSAVSTQKAAETSTTPVNADTAIADKSTSSPPAEHSKRFDTFVKQPEQPTSSTTGIYTLKKDEDGKSQIVSGEDKNSKPQQATALAEKAIEPSAAEENKKTNAPDDKDKAGKEDYGEITSSKTHFECDDAEHKANPALHNKNECKEVHGPITTRPATAVEAGKA